MTSQDSRSFWEKDIWPYHTDVMIVGGGLVGIHAALHYKIKFPEVSIAILEKGILEGGSSSKNAGFVCIGSPSELLTDIQRNGEDNVSSLLKRRYKGAEYIRTLAYRQEIEYNEKPGYEIFVNHQESIYQQCLDQLDYLNDFVTSCTGIDNPFEAIDHPDSFKQALGAIRCNYEANIHPAKWIEKLEALAISSGISFIRGAQVHNVSEYHDHLVVQSSIGEFATSKILWTTNAYSKGLFSLEEDVRMVKNQVYSWYEPTLVLEGTYHLHEGFIYLRKYRDYFIIGGARHIDQSDELMDYNAEIEEYLRTFVKQQLGIAFPTEFESWSGRLAVGKTKAPIINRLSSRQWAAYRLGGMGVALGPQTGRELAQKAWEDV